MLAWYVVCCVGVVVWCGVMGRGVELFIYSYHVPTNWVVPHAIYAIITLPEHMILPCLIELGLCSFVHTLPWIFINVLLVLFVSVLYFCLWVKHTFWHVQVTQITDRYMFCVCFENNFMLFFKLATCKFFTTLLIWLFHTFCLILPIAQRRHGYIGWASPNAVPK